MGFRTERWSIKPLSCPRPIRYCPDCGVTREFVCSERFRVNAQKKVIDVWLNYRCAECGNVWKLPVIERLPVAALDGALHDEFANHDRALAWKYAFDMNRLRAHVVRVQSDVGYTVVRTTIENANSPESVTGVVIDFDVPFVCDIRLDRLLAGELGVSRATIARWCDQGRLTVQKGASASLAKPVRHGVKLLLRDEEIAR